MHITCSITLLHMHLHLHLQLPWPEPDLLSAVALTLSVPVKSQIHARLTDPPIRNPPRQIKSHGLTSILLNLFCSLIMAIHF